MKILLFHSFLLINGGMAFRVRIKEAGNSPLQKLDETIVETFNPSKQDSQIHRHSLREVFNVIARQKIPANDQGQPTPEGILPETIQNARAFLIARLPGLYADLTGRWPGTKHRFLLDENLSKTEGLGLWHEFGRATHTLYEGLNGEKDPAVWKWATRRRIAAIITRDKRMSSEDQDLGMIAVRHAYDHIRRKRKLPEPLELPHLPLLIQISASSRQSVARIMKKHKEEIMDHLRHRRTPYICLTDYSCLSGPTYKEIAAYEWQTIKGMVGDITGTAKRRTGSSLSPS